MPTYTQGIKTPEMSPPSNDRTEPCSLGKLFRFQPDSAYLFSPSDFTSGENFGKPLPKVPVSKSAPYITYMRTGFLTSYKIAQIYVKNIPNRYKNLEDATTGNSVNRCNKAALKSYRNQQDHDLKISQILFCWNKRFSNSGSTEIAFSKAQT